jgi:squalene-hopene/tetraprenyl-beta-curcumene cyclase
LLKIQQEDGHWCGELEGDTILESEYILALYFMGRAEEDRVRKAANYLRNKALPGGGWANYPGGKADVSSSVKAYFVLKLLEDDPDASPMRKARKVIRDLGGLAGVNSFTRIYLALFGQYPWDRCPAVPPELILLPRWFPINLYELSSWSRAIVVPLSVIWASKPVRPVPAQANIDELWLETTVQPASRLGFWRNFYRRTGVTLKFLEKNIGPLSAPRRLLLYEHWMVDHFQNSDGIGAIFPPIINSIIAAVPGL